MSLLTEYPLISVNITTYNRSHLLERCLHSVIDQTYPSLEINIVDDFSTDDTSKVVESFQQKDQRIRYFQHTENKGNATARNTALKNTQGNYIAFMDDDDEWIDREKLSKQVELFNKSTDSKAGLCCTSVKIITDHSGNGIIKTISPPPNLLYKILVGNGFIFNSTVLIKKEVIEKVGMFDTTLKRGVDSDFYRNCIVHDIHVLFLNDVTTKVYEIGEDRMTNKSSEQQIEKHIQSNLHKLDKYAAILNTQKEAKAEVYEKIGDHYKNIFRLTHSKEKKKLAKSYYAKAFSTNKKNYRSLLKIILIR